ncbi:MAG: class II fructose-bisphosphate aldolase [Dehalococcoidales bacterium]|nr:class II fructose-bisphosphate aldolase [Dehalococcoidales bacterium]
MKNDEIETLVREMVFGRKKSEIQQQFRDMAKAAGIYPASIQNLYDAIGNGQYRGFTVPAINIRGLTYNVARAVFRAAIKDNVGPFIFEIARTEIGYTQQSPAEYTACLMAAGLVEGYRGPLFIQGDHYQVQLKKYKEDPGKELDAIRDLIRESIASGFYNIDIDASTMVDIGKTDLKEQQEANSRITAEMTRFIRDNQPEGITVSVGGEIGEIGTGNSTVGDLRAFMEQYRQALGMDIKGISKISVQTGTTHGGIALPDGTIASVNLDFDTLEKLSKIARDEYRIGGAVQHGASTLPDEMFDIFPRVGTLEVHLATGFQNMILDSQNFPPPLLEKVNAGVQEKYSADKKRGETAAQFIYRNRKRAFGDFKKEMWDIPAEQREKIGQELEERFSLLFRKLNVVGTREITDRVI